MPSKQKEPTYWTPGGRPAPPGARIGAALSPLLCSTRRSIWVSSPALGACPASCPRPHHAEPPAGVPRLLPRFPREAAPLIPRGANRGPGVSRSSADLGQGPEGLWATQHTSVFSALPSSSPGTHRSRRVCGWMLPRASAQARFTGQRDATHTCSLGTGGQTRGLVQTRCFPPARLPGDAPVFPAAS